MVDLDNNNIVLWIAIAALMFGGGFMFIFFVGASTDYSIPGSDKPSGEWLQDNLPTWMFPPRA